MRIRRFVFLFLVVFFLSVFIALMVTSTSHVTLQTDAMPAEPLPCVILDAGHGGEDGGAVSADGISEKAINLSIAQKTNDLLQLFGLKTQMTRIDDNDISEEGDTIRERKLNDMKKRLSIFNSSENNTIISIHQNKFSNTASHGTQVFYSPNNDNSTSLAEAIHFSVKTQLQPNNERKCKPSDDGIYLLKNTTQPAVIVECGFLSNREECAKLADEGYQKQMSFAITTGFLDYINTNKDVT
ncbi:MAG: N-acetylmuramoyl-L-alanine amidase [Ruminococcus sp.]|nr:N-acetylmuramoyl-L-alanine amidase [Ruminococcus sp.]MBQ4260945.1 N-acetylmuramoyl-L-alanine amidase [Ruminococcus sp.]